MTGWSSLRINLGLYQMPPTSYRRYEMTMYEVPKWWRRFFSNFVYFSGNGDFIQWGVVFLGVGDTCRHVSGWRDRCVASSDLVLMSRCRFRRQMTRVVTCLVGVIEAPFHQTSH
jgi:hypothetical protein